MAEKYPKLNDNDQDESSQSESPGVQEQSENDALTKDTVGIVDSPSTSSEFKKSDDKSSQKDDSGVGDWDRGSRSAVSMFKRRKKLKRSLRATSSSPSSNEDSGLQDSGLQDSSSNSNAINSLEDSEDRLDMSSDSDDISNYDVNLSPELNSSSDSLEERGPCILLGRDIDLFDPDEDESMVCFLADKFTRPKYNWHVAQEIRRRQLGCSSHLSSDLFRVRCGGSLHVVERLELMYKMEAHQGCVNSLNFNCTGTRLASGSDDLDIAIWDWTIGESVLVYSSGHYANVFQSKFLPKSGDCHIVSCGRDGQVRLAELSSDGTCKGTRKVAHHRGSAHKISIEPQSTQVVLSCGEDAVVYQIDLRESKPRKLVTCSNSDGLLPLYSIHAHPMKPYEFIVGGKDHFVRIYDKRYIRKDKESVKKICPTHLRESNICPNVTCCVYNHDGSEILASYNDEDIYLFNSSMLENESYKYRYRGHRNYKTVKGVNFFGSESQYIVSGSDCGNIFFWEKCSSRIVQCMPGDDAGVVNCLEPHPNIPIIATSGLDNDIKIWVPSNEQTPDLTQYKDVVRKNHRERAVDKNHENNLDHRMFWFIMDRINMGIYQHNETEVDDLEFSSSSDENSDFGSSHPAGS